MEDLIKRSDAIKVVKKYRGLSRTTMAMLADDIRAIPSADRPSGEWIPFEYGDDTWHKCSVCGTADKYIRRIPRPNGSIAECVSIRNYCPNCGARMREADDGTR